MKYGEVIPIGFTQIDWQLLLTTLRNDFGLKINQPDLRDPTAFLKILSGGELTVNRHILQFANLTVITKLQEAHLVDLSQTTSLHVRLIDQECVIVTGTITAWRDAVFAGCTSDDGNSNRNDSGADEWFGEFCTSILNLFLASPYKILFAKYKQIRTATGRIILL